MTRGRTSPHALTLARVAAVCACAFALHAPAAFAHAQLLDTIPPRDAVVPTQPAEVVFEFNQPVGGTLGAVKVYDAKGDEVDDGDITHPGGRQSWMGVGLRVHLPDGTYVATYRVISADTHVVYGGNVFSIGHQSAGATVTVGALIARNKAGPVTDVAFAAVRALDYASIALVIGVLAFLWLVWRPALVALADAQPQWSHASDAFARRAGLMLAAGIVLGIVVGVLGILLQGATAAGVSLWSAVNVHIVNTVLDSRFGWVWGTRALVLLAFGGLAAGAWALHRRPIPGLASAALGADGVAVSTPPGWLVAAGAATAAYLAVTPALSGHAGVDSPRGVLFPANVVHVSSMAVWLGGLATLVIALPAATRSVTRPDRTRLLAGALVRFSPVALTCVIALLVTGVLQAYLQIRSWHGLFHSAYGAAVIIKFCLLMVLVGLGALNRQRAIPGLRRAVAGGAPPGELGVMVRRTLRAEVVLIAVVLCVTGALVSYTPPVDATQGPFATNVVIGPAELEMDVEPARAGPNTIHLYLINPRDGAQFTATKELDITAALPAKGIGPLTLTPTPAGPGHYIVAGATLIPPGTWSVQITLRVSSFDEYLKTIKVPIS